MNSIECEVSICGETGTGKTCLRRRLIDDDFENSNESTVVATIKSKTIELSEGVHINFSIVDTPGQEKFRALNRVFFQRVDIVILVYNITNRSSFEEIQKYWLNYIRNYGKKIQVYIDY